MSTNFWFYVNHPLLCSCVSCGNSLSFRSPASAGSVWRDHGTAELTQEAVHDEVCSAIDYLFRLDISMEEVTQELEDVEEKSFADAFIKLLDSVEKRQASAI